jgi:hypothetical protein
MGRICLRRMISSDWMRRCGWRRAYPRNLFDQVTEHCARLSLRQAGRTTEIDGMIEAAAWTDAAVALINIELPTWSIRRLVCEDGEWLCSLSRHPYLPMFLDKPVERSHRVLALAILRAFVAARLKSAATHRVTSSVPQVGARPAYVFCCDNFAKRAGSGPAAMAFMPGLWG